MSTTHNIDTAPDAADAAASGAADRSVALVEPPVDTAPLAATLRAATAELVAERGPAGFSLREVARRAGVSHAAPGHHYGSTKGLLTAVAADGYTALAAVLRDAIDAHDDPREQLRAGGKGYLDLAARHPGHYALMFSPDLLDHDDERISEAGESAFATLVECVQGIADRFNPDLEVEAAATMAWATMAGLVEIGPKVDHVAEQPEKDCPPHADMTDGIIDLMIAGFMNG